MEMKFYVKSEQLDETKKAIRSLDSLRFMSNPSIVGDRAYISISGDVKDMNKFSEYLSTVNSGVKNAS
jgi:hypothetical protein